MTMRAAACLLVALTAVVVCASCGNDDGRQASGADTPAAAGAADKLAPGKCPVDESDVAAAVGRELKSDPMGVGFKCRFGDGTTVVTVVAVSGVGSIQQDREQNSGSTNELVDLDRGDEAILYRVEDHWYAEVAYGELILQVTLQGVGDDRANVQRIALALIDAAAR